MREVVLDTETTGLNPQNGDRIVEVGAIELVNHVPTGNSFHTYLNPLIDGEMSDEAFKVHGLTTDFLSDKPLFSEIIVKLFNFIGTSNLIIHNAKFDIGFINHEIGTLKDTDPETYQELPYKEIDINNVIDTLEIAKNLYPGKSVSLDSLCIKFGINNKRQGKHGALIDSEILSEIYLELVGGKQPGFQFAHQDIGVSSDNRENRKRRKFIRKKPLESTRLSQEEILLHKKFVSEMKKNFWF